MNAARLLLAFVVGSSIVSTAPSEWYMGKSYDRAGCPCDLAFFGHPDLKFWLYPIVVPVLFGLANVGMVLLQDSLDVNPWLIAAFVGALFGFLLSLVGRFGFDFPRKVFGFRTEAEQASVHWMAPVVYALIFAVVVQGLNRLLLRPKN